MAIDLQRGIRAAVQAALDDAPQQQQAKPKKPFLSAGRAMMLGAGLVAAGRVLSGSRGSELLGSLEQRLEGTVGLDRDEEAEEPEDEEGYDEEPEAEEDEDPEDEEGFDEEPEAEEDEDLEAEEDEEPEAEEDEDLEDEDYDEEPEAEEDEEPAPRRRRRTPAAGRR